MPALGTRRQLEGGVILWTPWTGSPLHVGSYHSVRTMSWISTFFFNTRQITVSFSLLIPIIVSEPEPTHYLLHLPTTSNQYVYLKLIFSVYPESFLSSILAVLWERKYLSLYIFLSFFSNSPNYGIPLLQHHHCHSDS